MRNEKRGSSYENPNRFLLFATRTSLLAQEFNG